MRWHPVNHWLGVGIILLLGTGFFLPAAATGAEGGKPTAAPPPPPPPEKTAPEAPPPASRPAAPEGAPPKADPPAVEPSRMVQSLEELASMLDRELTGLWGETARKEKVVAVVRFSENGPIAREKQLGAAIQAKLHTSFQKLGYQMVEREHMAEILKEVEMQQWGLLDDSKAADMAKMAGADFLLLGSVSELGDRFLVSARVVSKETGTTIAAQEVEIPSATLIAISSESVVLRTRWDSTYRSMIAVGWGQFYNDDPIKAWIFIGAEVLSVGSVIGLHFGGLKVYNDYKGVKGNTQEDQRRRDRKFALAERLILGRNIMIGACVGIWAVNVLDAALSGRTYVRNPDGSISGPAPERRAFLPTPAWGAPGLPSAGLQLQWTY